MAYVIAEAGCNHLGNMDRARRMIEAAALAGADCVKFQVYEPELLVGVTDATRAFCEQARLYVADIALLEKVCELNDVDFLASAFDIPSLELLAGLGIKKLKIPAGQIHNAEYMERAGRMFNHEWIFMSTGMATGREVFNASNILWSLQPATDSVKFTTRHTIMHCTTAYPVPLDAACMRAMGGYGYGRKVGFSDHTMTDVCAIMAVAMGAKVIEHHFYLDKVDCPDMPASFCIAKLKSYIQYIRDAEVAMGAGQHKFIQPCEKIHLKRRDESC